jgi:hypothetical protein
MNKLAYIAAAVLVASAAPAQELDLAPLVPP